MALTPKEAREIACEAYIYGFPLVDSYRINHAYFVDRGSSEFKAPWNEIASIARVFTPEDKAIQTPNSDTPYSFAGLDLRAEPMVLTIPPIETGRYFSVQLLDAYTHNFDYIGSRTTGNGGGRYLIAGPGWAGEAPVGVDKVFRSETEICFAFYRTQLLDPADLDKVKAIQAQYRVTPLSAFTGAPPPPAPPALDFVKPLPVEEQRTSPAFFGVLSFVLGYCPVHPSEREFRDRLARLGIGGGSGFDPARWPAEVLQAVRDGMSDAWARFAAFKASDIDTLKVTAGDVFGTRAYLQNRYLHRMAGAVLGIYGNSKEEALYPLYLVDAEGAQPDASKKSYALRFAADQLPPVDFFWSLTLYELPSSLLCANALDRYLINSPMLPKLKRDADGGVTIRSSTPRPAPSAKPTGFPRRRARSSWFSVSTDRRPQRSPAPGSSRRSNRWHCPDRSLAT
ncbi:MAG: DUF1254 domain-containing protein [Dongiaceae bacterium]